MQVAHKQLREELQWAVSGDQIDIVFAKHSHGIQGVSFLLRFMEWGMLRLLRDSDHTVLLAVQLSRDWNSDENRRYSLVLGPGWDLDTFCARMEYGLESVQLNPAPFGLPEYFWHRIRNGWSQRLLDELTDPALSAVAPQGDAEKILADVEAGRPVEKSHFLYESFAGFTQDMGIRPCDVTDKVLAKFFKK